MNRRIPIAALLLGLATAAPALGAPPAPAPTVRDALSVDARSKFDEGSQLYKAARYAEARDAFFASYAMSGDARILYNVAVCEKALGRYASAIALLKKSLTTTERQLSPEYTQRAIEAVATLSRYVAFVTVESLIDGSAIAVDGAPLRESPMALDPGTHTFVATKDGYDPASASVVVKGGDTPRVVLAPTPSAKPGVAKITCLGVVRCEVRVGDEVLGQAPVSFSRGPGSYLVRATVDGRAWSEQKVDLQNGRTIEIALVGRAPPLAHLRVTTDRTDDTVVVDGARTSRSGADIELAPGEHHVVISRPDGTTKSFDLLLRDNETRDLRVALDEKKGGISAWWFVGGGAVLAGAASAIYFATRPTKFEGNAAGTLNPYVVPAHAGVFR